MQFGESSTYFYMTTLLEVKNILKNLFLLYGKLTMAMGMQWTTSSQPNKEFADVRFAVILKGACQERNHLAATINYCVNKDIKNVKVNKNRGVCSLVVKGI